MPKILVTTTIYVGMSSTPFDTMYLDLISPPNPLNNPLTNQLGTQWHEVYPDYCTRWQLVFNTYNFVGGALNPGDNIILQALTGPEIGTARSYNVITLETDIVTEPATCCQLRGDVAIPKDGSVLVNDLVWLVNYLFKGGTAPSCLNEGDCAIPLDGSCLVNDLVWLVNYLFKSGTPPPPC